MQESGHRSWNILCCNDKSIQPGNPGSTALSIDHSHSSAIKYLFSLFTGGHSSAKATAMSAGQISNSTRHHFTSYLTLAGILRAFGARWQRHGDGLHTYRESCGARGVIISSFPRLFWCLFHCFAYEDFSSQGAIWDRCNTKLFFWGPWLFTRRGALSSIRSISIAGFRFPTWVNYRKGHSRGS